MYPDQRSICCNSAELSRDEHSLDGVAMIQVGWDGKVVSKCWCSSGAIKSKEHERELARVLIEPGKGKTYWLEDIEPHWIHDAAAVLSVPNKRHAWVMSA
jgi:hypothetical protein